MSGNPSLKCDRHILESSINGPILEMVFSGQHGDSVGHDLGRYVAESVASDMPAAVLLNFLKFDYSFGNDIGGILQAFVVRDGATGKVTPRPCAILARGATGKGLRSLLEVSRIPEVCDVSFFQDAVEAQAHLRKRVAETGS